MDLKRSFICAGAFFFLLFVSAGCGYRLARSVNPLLDNVTSIAIPYFKNKTFEPGAETIFTHAFVNEFVESKKLNVVSAQDADVVLYGTVKILRENSIAYDVDDKALEYRVTVTLAVSLEDRSSGKVLWRRKNLKHSEEFLVSDDIVFSETTKRDALKTLAEDLAERVHDSIMQGF
jgi:hypothetical protein